MKQLILLTLVSITNNVFAVNDAELKSIQEFLVISTEKDASIATDSAIFEFRVMNPELLSKTGDKKGYASANDVPLVFQFGEDGIFTHKVKAGCYRFLLFINPENDEYIPGYFGYFEIYSDSIAIQPGYRTKVELRFRPADREIMVDKPVLYFYSEESTAFSVNVKPVGQFTFTYPSIENGWNGTTNADGTVQIDKRTYPYLFWEAKCPLAAANVDLSQGFVVSREEMVAFLEDQLSAMGLNEREQTDFITFWGPKLSGNASNFVHFLFNNSCDVIADLSISPEPNATFRVYMLWADISENAIPTPTPQIIPNFQRSGFSVVEWGGSEIPVDQLQPKIANR